MKEFMREEMISLEAVGALTIQESLNQVEILKALQQQQEDLTQQMEHRMQVNLVEALAQYGHMEREMQSDDQHDNDVNAVSNLGSNDNALLQAIETLTARINTMSTDARSQNGKNKNELPTVNPRTGRPYKRYCWTHGCCAHWGRHCNAKKAGHCDDATFKDRKGGSNKGCLPLIE